MQKLKDLYRKMFKSKFTKNIALIAGGTAFAQAIGIIFSPIITRIYPPEEFGILTVYVATLGLLAIVASFDYQKAIPIAEDDEKAINVLALATLVLLIFVLATALLFAFCGDEILNLLDSEVLKNYKYLVPVGVFFVGSYDILLQWSYRIRSYKVISKTKVNQSISSNILKVILGLFKIGPIGLIFGNIIGQSWGITTLSKPILKDKKILKEIKLIKIANMAKRHINFPLYSAPSNYVYTAGTQLPIIFLTSLFGSTTVGLFGLANSIVRMPISLIGTSVAQVFYSEAANIGKSDPLKLKKISMKLVKELSIIGLIPLFILLLFGPWLFSIVFGKEWYEAGVYARILSVMVYFHFIITPVGRILEIFEKQREGLFLNVLRLALIFIVFGFAKIMKLSSFQAVVLYSISNSLTYLLLLLLVQVVMNKQIKKDE